MGDPGEAPHSLHSPHASIPELDGVCGHQCFPITTIASLLLGGAPEPQPQKEQQCHVDEALCLFLQSDPPLPHCPPPDEDDCRVLDIRLDPEPANIDINAFSLFVHCASTFWPRDGPLVWL